MVPLHFGLQGSQQEILFPGRSEELCIFFRTFKTCKTNTKTNSLTYLCLSIWCVCHTHMHTHYTPVCVGMHLRRCIGKGKVNGHLAGLGFLPPPWGSWDCLGCQTCDKVPLPAESSHWLPFWFWCIPFAILLPQCPEGWYYTFNFQDFSLHHLVSTYLWLVSLHICLCLSSWRLSVPLNQQIFVSC